MNLAGPLATLDETFADVADNLAADEALLVRAEQAGGPATLRFWELDHPAVVLGASCRLRDNVRLDVVQRDGVPIARRSSGGGTVVIGPGALNITVVLPIAAEPVAFRSVDRAQQFVLERMAAALRPAGPEVVMLGSGDLTIAGRKCSGSAQRRLRHFLMIHASLLYNFDLDLIDRYLTMPPRQPSYRANRPHADFVANVPLSRATIVHAIESIWQTRPAVMAGDLALLDLIAELSQRKFKDFRWIERL